MPHERLFDAQIVYDALDQAGENGYNVHNCSTFDQAVDLMTYYQPLERADLRDVVEVVQTWRNEHAAAAV